MPDLVAKFILAWFIFYIIYKDLQNRMDMFFVLMCVITHIDVPNSEGGGGGGFMGQLFVYISCSEILY